MKTAGLLSVRQERVKSQSLLFFKIQLEDFQSSGQFFNLGWIYLSPLQIQEKEEGESILRIKISLSILLFRFYQTHVYFGVKIFC